MAKVGFTVDLSGDGLAGRIWARTTVGPDLG
jgi:hypothetical protein